MATNHTENYNLNLWAPTDTFLRTEFNENTQKLDAALKSEADARAALAQTVNAKADASTVTALSQTVAAKADAAALDGLIVTGIAGTRGSSDKTIDLGFYPRLALLFTSEGSMELLSRDSKLYFQPGSPVSSGGYNDRLTTSGIVIAKKSSSPSFSTGSDDDSPPSSSTTTTNPAINYLAFR